jgi:hypothetical protein
MKKLKNVHVRPLLPDAQLGPRQWRIVRGLLEAGVSWDEIRGLPWYDPKLERFYPDTVTNLSTQPVDGHAEPVECDHPEVDTDGSHATGDPEAGKKLSRAEKARLRRGKGDGGDQAT